MLNNFHSLIHLINICSSQGLTLYVELEGGDNKHKQINKDDYV